jgi:hypothetical protein
MAPIYHQHEMRRPKARSLPNCQLTPKFGTWQQPGSTSSVYNGHGKIYSYAYIYDWGVCGCDVEGPGGEVVQKIGRC